jgi:tripartite-type tricarboxylate transporter receptor subunit TctC
MKRRTFLIAGGAGALATGLPAISAWADPWPARPIRLIVPYPAGGGSDNIARFLGERLGASLGQAVVIENRGGAGATIGTQVAANAAGDGYTLLLAPTAVLALTPQLRKVPYDPASLRTVAKVSATYGLAVARKDLPANNIAELIALSKKAPGKLSFGSAGTATITHLTGEIANMQLGINALHVPYKGSAPALNDLIGGQIDLMYDAVALAAIKNGQAKALAATGTRRHPELPDVPTMNELGYDIDSHNWYGLFAPEGTPPEIIGKLATEVEKVLADPATIEKMETFSQYPDFQGPARFAKTVADDTAFFKDLIAKANIEIQ